MTDTAAPKVTREQAYAFLESLVGFVDLSEFNGRPKSEHARTHLQAALGLRNLPSSDAIWRLAGGYQGAWDGKEVAPLVDYLGNVVEALRGTPEREARLAELEAFLHRIVTNPAEVTADKALAFEAVQAEARKIYGEAKANG